MSVIRTSRIGQSVGAGLVLAVAVALLMMPVTGGAHVDSTELTDPCGSCHVGHGAKGEPMLLKAEEKFCYQCHGSQEERAEMVAMGKLKPGVELDDLSAEFNKAYGHPVKRSGEHSPIEILPDYAGSAVSHAECVDCHNPHERVTGKGDMGYKVKGYSLSGQYLEESVYEYEICLKCHTDHLGTKTSDRSLVKAFARSARSQHPVTAPSTGLGSPSLLDKTTAGQYMKCSDCHWSGNEEGPRGPHGSRHEFLLSGNYSRDPYGTESPFAYQFCYSCHDRMSILGNESFPLHREHIEGDLAQGTKGTSCYTCHASHGAPDSPHLIMFNGLAVSPAKSGRPASYDVTGTQSGTCVLMCHGYNHEPGSY